MKKLPLFLLLTLGATLASKAEDVYVTVDEEGVPEFSDQKLPNSTRIELQEPVIFKNPDQQSLQQRRTVKLSPADKEAAPHYDLQITDPPNDTAVRENSGQLLLTVSIKPQPLPGHTAELLMDGRKVRDLAGSGPVELANLDRGTHQFSIRIVDQNGRVIATGPASTISMLRYAVRRGN